MSVDTSAIRPRRLWADHRTLWRWHFYAGLFCIPFVVVLALTGAVYLFKPQIEQALDRPYAGLSLAGPARSPSQIAAAAVAAVPGSTLRAYQLPAAPNDAVKVEVSRGERLTWVYVKPDDLKPLKVIDEDDRLMRVMFRLHGELLMGDRGSNLVELAACWAIVMIVTGLALWWPRGSAGLAGVVWPRLGGGYRQVLRDLHAVIGFWVSLLALFLLLTGLPWAKNWGGYLKQVRQMTGAVQPMDWTTGRKDELAQRAAADRETRAAEMSEHAEHMAMMGDMNMAGMEMSGGRASPDRYAALNLLVPRAQALALPPPVLISPPRKAMGPWTVKSDTPNRPQRTEITFDAATVAQIGRLDFGDKHWIDQAVGVGVAAHEGQLFGPLNQALGVFTALGLVVLSVTGFLMWLKRRPADVLGAPPAAGAGPVGAAAIAVALALCLYLPLLAVSALGVLVVERLALRRIAPAARFLGLRPVVG